MLKTKLGWLSPVSVRIGSSQPNSDLDLIKIQTSTTPIAVHASIKVTPREQHGNACRCRVLFYLFSLILPVFFS